MVLVITHSIPIYSLPTYFFKESIVAGEKILDSYSKNISLSYK